MDNHNDAGLEQPKRLIARFAIFKALVNDGDGIEFEYRRDVGKVNAMFADVDQPLIFVPFESHARIVVSNWQYVK